MTEMNVMVNDTWEKHEEETENNEHDDKNKLKPQHDIRGSCMFFQSSNISRVFQMLYASGLKSCLFSGKKVEAKLSD